MPRPKGDFGPRVRRAVAMIPWLLREGTTTVAALAERFDLPEDDITRDLAIVSMCGVPPYGGGDLIDVVIDDDGTVYAHGQRFYDRPLALSPAEGFAVLASGRALLEVSKGDAALASALEKLERALGASGALDVDLEEPPLLPVFQQAVADAQTVEGEYHSAWRDRVSRRCLDPLLVYSFDGRWYVQAFDHDSGEDRHFRVDRFLSAAPTGDTFTPRAVDPPDSAYSPGEAAVAVTVALPATAGWAIEAYPARDVAERPDGRIEATFDVVGETWLGRLLLKAGPGAEVLAPAELAHAGRTAALYLLRRYPA